jgi:hypothetical protein
MQKQKYSFTTIIQDKQNQQNGRQPINNTTNYR